MILQQSVKFIRYFIIVTAMSLVFCAEVTQAYPFVGGFSGGVGFYGRGFTRPFFSPSFNPVVTTPYFAAPTASYVYPYAPSPYIASPAYGASYGVNAASSYCGASSFYGAPSGASSFYGAPSPYYAPSPYVAPYGSNPFVNSYAYSPTPYLRSYVSSVGPTGFYSPYLYNNGSHFY